MEGREQSQLLYKKKYDSIESALLNVSNFVKDTGNGINTMFILCKSEIRETLVRTPDDYIASIQNVGKSTFTLKITRLDEITQKKEELNALCLESKFRSMFMILSDCKYVLFRRLLGRIINFNYPLLSRVFLRDIEIKRLFFIMENEHDFRIIVNRLLSYSRLSDVTQEKDLRWTRKPYVEIFEELSEHNAWIKKIDFNTWKQEIKENIPVQKKVFHGAISRDCNFIVKGDFEKFYNYIITSSLRMISERLGYLEERSESAKNRRPEPIVLQFNTPQFKEEGWNEKFIESMAKLKNASITELHTNPYVHLSLLDYRDGSSYGIWIISENEINIIPQVRATVASMTRLA